MVRDAVTELGSLVVTGIADSSNHRGHVMTPDTRSEAGAVTVTSSKVTEAAGGPGL